MSTAQPCQARRFWCYLWAAWTLTLLVTGVVGDVTAYITEGWEATLTAHVRRWIGAEPRTRRGRVGQVAVGGFLAWACVHLSLGVLGPSRGRHPVTRLEETQ